MKPMSARLRTAVPRLLSIAALIAMALVETAGRRWGDLM
jgi:hypothetical protein